MGCGRSKNANVLEINRIKYADDTNAAFSPTASSSRVFVRPLSAIASSEEALVLAEEGDDGGTGVGLEEDLPDIPAVPSPFAIPPREGAFTSLWEDSSPLRGRVTGEAFQRVASNLVVRFTTKVLQFSCLLCRREAP
eukprot:SAG31_NODE_134_length_23213_cov_5.698624_12_plen_137_part_00